MSLFSTHPADEFSNDGFQGSFWGLQKAKYGERELLGYFYDILMTKKVERMMNIQWKDLRTKQKNRNHRVRPNV